MSRSLLVPTLLAGCISPAYEQYLQHGDGASAESSSTGDENAADTTGSTGDAASTSSGSADGTGASAADTTDATPDSSTTSTATTGTAEDPSVGDAEKPEILEVILPAEVHAAGPVPITVVTEHVGVVHVQLDGVDAGDLLAAGDGTFTGKLPVHGAIDNGPHEVEVIATQGELAVHRTAHYNVKTPIPGTEAWSQAGPEGSRTNRVAVTSDGDLIEVGQTEIDGVLRPTIRKRSAVSGAELWPEGTIILDTREGAVVDVAALPDGRIWVAMNLREPMKDPRPRFTLLEADGHATGIDIFGTSGRVVRGLAVDADGGCFAVGVAGVQGDWDYAYWRIDAEGIQTLGDVYDYKPQLLPHEFRDVAADVLIDGDRVYVIGASQGPHELNKVLTRGIVLSLDLHTGEVTTAAMVAPADDSWTQSAFFGGALHPDGVLVTGYGCDASCEQYRIETSLYNSLSGQRLLHMTQAPNPGLTYGSDVALDSQGRALVAGAVTQNGKLRGYLFGRPVEPLSGVVLEHWYPGAGSSEALGVVRDAYDRIFPAGYITVNGAEQARITLIHG